MSEIIPITWYLESPIDFEHKQYILLSYLQKVDDSFLFKKLSPHYLHMEKMIIEMMNFQNSLIDIRKTFDKERYVFFEDNSKLEGEKNELIDEINEIVDFSLPQVKTRLELGRFILRKNNQVLY
jgi:hypothetical protein